MTEVSDTEWRSESVKPLMNLAGKFSDVQNVSLDVCGGWGSHTRRDEEVMPGGGGQSCC